ncbi:glycerol-3-phosphate dehydrogenase C-terminal domain-containing protein [Marinobacterium aestuariivivens]|uniref:Glycerol-3-phosphate dehydrogenase C-terminal domain-containing protein n=1 Tax=Marinobacterium aestuariivivens TaxID=1698799 RepID=A0ABW1ZUZ2_9GAMM
MPVAIVRRYVRTYGTLSHLILDGCGSLDDLGRSFGATLHEREVKYLVEHEWAQSVDDILWRRTKLGLYLQEKERAELESYLNGLLGRRNLALVSSRA